MIYEEENKCLCGHDEGFHVDHTDIGIESYCVGDFACECTTFKLDNLKYVEELARKKGLV